MGTHPIFQSDFDCLTDRNRTRCVPNCVTFPASRSIPVTVCARSVMTVSQFVSSRQSAPCPTQRQGPKGRRWLVLHRVARQEATEARDPPKTTLERHQGRQGEEECLLCRQVRRPQVNA